MESIWIMGCGDIGRRVARLYQPNNQQLNGWVRSDAARWAGAAAGIMMQQGDMDTRPDLSAHDFDEAAIFWFMPPPAMGDRDSRLRFFLQQVQAAPRRIVLISTTGVYGDCGGRWIDETAPVQPQTARARRRVDAECALQAWGEQFEREWLILRVPGIYAADRLPIARLQRGEPVICAAQAPWTNRIHADDLARIAQRAMHVQLSGCMYNACDSQSSTMTDYFNQVADYVGLARPPQISLEEAQQVLSAGMLTYLQESRRISNERLLQDLEIALRYPSLVAALQANPA